jgi:hypothetical protein
MKIIISWNVLLLVEFHRLWKDHVGFFFNFGEHQTAQCGTPEDCFLQIWKSAKNYPEAYLATLLASLATMLIRCDYEYVAAMLTLALRSHKGLVAFCSVLKFKFLGVR